jgi:DNA-binding IclR family transcriptional regulator
MPSTRPAAATAASEPATSLGDRILDVMETFADGSYAQTLDEVQALSGLPRSTTYRLLTLLTRRRWIEHTALGYRLGPCAVSIGRRAEGHEALRAAAAETLNELQLASGAVAHLTVLEGVQTCHLDKVGGRAWGEVPSQVGVRLPVTETVGGRCILALMSPEEVDTVLDMIAESGMPTVDRAALNTELVAARRRQGVLVRSGEDRPSRISSAAAPVVGPDGPVAAVSIAWRHTGPDLNRAASLVAVAAKRVSEELHPGWRRTSRFD